MNKESFSQRIDSHKKQIESEKNTEKQRCNLQFLELEKEKRQKQINEQKEKAERKRLTIENFRGSEIIETLEEIRDNEILIFGKTKKTEWVKKLFGEKRIDTEGVIPAIIKYDLNKVSLLYEYYYRDGSGDYGDPIERYEEISISKVDENTFCFQNNKTTSDETIDNIAKFIAEIDPSYMTEDISSGSYNRMSIQAEILK